MHPTRILVITAILLFLCAGIAFAGGLGLGLGLSDAFKSPIPEPTATTIAYEPAERPALRERLALEDDFSQERWAVYHDSDHHKGYENEQYFIAV